MKKARRDVLIVDANGSRSALHWLIERLAKHPGWVTLMTFFSGAVVAWVILGIDDRLTLTDTVTLLATLWALFFAVMIYLLSAEDTDNILGQISELQDQLSTALSEPGVEAEGAAGYATPGWSDDVQAPPDVAEPVAASPEERPPVRTGRCLPLMSPPSPTSGDRVPMNRRGPTDGALTSVSAF